MGFYMRFLSLFRTSHMGSPSFNRFIHIFLPLYLFPLLNLILRILRRLQTIITNRRRLFSRAWPFLRGGIYCHQFWKSWVLRLRVTQDVTKSWWVLILERQVELGIVLLALLIQVWWLFSEDPTVPHQFVAILLYMK